MSRAFAWLWSGQSLGVVGSSFALLALPSVAILTLNANPLEVGLLEALQTVGFPVFGLPIGVLVDRWPRRRVLVLSNVGRAAALAAIPLAARAGALTIATLSLVAAVVGVLNVFFAVAYQAVLPDVVEAAHLPRANARLEVSNSLAQALGNGGGGALVGLVGAPLAIVAVAVAYAASAFALARVRVRAVETIARSARASFSSDLREGWNAVFATRGLPELLGSTATANLGGGVFGAAYLLYAYRTLHLAPATVGFVFVFGEIGFVGALLAPHLAKRFGFGRTLLAAQMATAFGAAIVPLAGYAASLPAAFCVLLVAQLIGSCAIPTYNVLQVSYRQGAVAPALQGRVNATARTIVWGTLPIGAALGGAVAGRIGFAATLEAGAAIAFCSAFWLATPAVRTLEPTASGGIPIDATLATTIAGPPLHEES